MTDNPYQTPKSELGIKTNQNLAQFYVVSVRKFTILFFSTLGFYIIYWFYKNWAEYKTHTGKNIWPVPRAFFYIFFTHSLFTAVQNTLKKQGALFNWNPNLLATAYVALTIVSRLLDSASIREIGSPLTDLLSFLTLPLTYFILVKPQKAINLSQNDPEGRSNNQLTTGNYVWIITGVILWALVLLGLAIMFVESIEY